LLFGFYDYLKYSIKKYNENCKENDEMKELLNKNPYYVLE